MTQYAYDYSWARPDPAAIKASGVNYVCRYLGPDKTGKCLTKAEALSLLSHGIAIIPNFESSATRAMQGYDAGVADGAYANAQGNAIGIPSNVPIIYSVDTDPGSPPHPQIVAYFQGLNKAGGRPVDAYGGAGLLRALRGAGLIPAAPSGWNSNARSWDHGSTDPTACLLQLTSHPVHIAGTPDNQVDVSLVQHAPKAWGGEAIVDDMTPEQAASLLRIEDAVVPKADPKTGKMPDFNMLDAVNWITLWLNKDGYAGRGKQQGRLEQVLAIVSTTKDSGLDPKAIADAIATNLGDNVAKEVADELATRLKS